MPDRKPSDFFCGDAFLKEIIFVVASQRQLEGWDSGAEIRHVRLAKLRAKALSVALKVFQKQSTACKLQQNQPAALQIAENGGSQVQVASVRLAGAEEVSTDAAVEDVSVELFFEKRRRELKASVQAV